MSKAKFAAAKELIQEKKYDEARAILRTVDHPTAQTWLKKLDDLDPPFPQVKASAPPPPTIPMPPQGRVYHEPLPSPEQQRYYERENHRASRRSLLNGIRLVMGGVFMLILFGYFMSTRTNLITGRTIALGPEACLLPLGLLSILGGLYRISRRNR